MKTISDKLDIHSPVICLFLFSFLLGVEIVLVNENIDTKGLILISEPIFSLGNLFMIYVAAVFFFISFREKESLLKIAYFLGGTTFVLSSSIIKYFGYKYLFFLKIALMFIVCLLCMRFLTNTLEKWKVSRGDVS